MLWGMGDQMTQDRKWFPLNYASLGHLVINGSSQIYARSSSDIRLQKFLETCPGLERGIGSDLCGYHWDLPSWHTHPTPSHKPTLPYLLKHYFWEALLDARGPLAICESGRKVQTTARLLWCLRDTYGTGAGGFTFQGVAFLCVPNNPFWPLILQCSPLKSPPQST